MRPTYVSTAELEAAISFEEAVDALDDAFRATDPAAGPARSHLEIPGGELLLMPAYAGEDAGVKLVTIAQGNPARGLPLIHGVYVLFAPETLVPIAIFDGAALTALRTASVSALATRYLAHPDARRVVIFGAGAQARAHAHAMRAVRPVEHITVVGSGSGRAAALAAELREQGIDAETGTAAAVESADIVCTCTTSKTPVFAAGLVRPGTHVNAIGAYRPDARELEASLLTRSRVVVETRASALLEAGDVVLAIADGALHADALHELAPVVRGEVSRADADITVFKSVGLALEDLAVAAAAAAKLAVAA